MLSIVLLTLVFVFYFWRLSSQTTGIGPKEYASRQISQSSAYVFDHGINAPYYLLQHGLVKGLRHHQTLGLRLSSALTGLLVLVALYSLLRNWFGRNTALCALVIFASTPWLVLSARTGGPDIMYFWTIVMLAIFYKWLKSGKKIRYWWIILCLAVVIGLYTPGIIWLGLAAALLLRSVITAHLKRISRTYLIGGLLVGLLLLVPLVQALVAEPSRLKQLFLIPANWPGIAEPAKSIGWSLSALVWRLRAPIDISIDRLAIFNILQVVLALFGIYALGGRAKKLTYSLAGILLFAVLAAGLNHNPYLLSLGLLAVAVFMSAGLRFLYIEWRRIFPLNPFAKALALGLILVVVATHLLFALRFNLVAWPHTEAIKSSYVLK